jgi:hypothetical protein
VEPDVDYAERRGYGDGVLQITAGARVVLFRRVRTTGHLALGYSYWHQVVDDPGDNYSMVDNHFVGLGFGLEIGPRGAAQPVDDGMTEPTNEALPASYEPPANLEPPPPPEGVDSPWDVSEVEPDPAPEEAPVEEPEPAAEPPE